MKTQRKTLVRLLALALGIAGGSEALAATRYFDCASGNMQTASCWSGNIKPVAGDDAILGFSSFASNVTAALNSGSFVATNEYLGFSGGYSGTINHSAGSNTVSNNLIVGYASQGTYNLSGTGNLSTTNTVVGRNGIGLFDQTGGTHTVSGNLTLGQNFYGFYELTGGTLNVAGSILSGAGSGQLEIMGGSLVVGGGNGSINVDYFSIHNGGTHTLSGTGSIAVDGSLTVGYQSSGSFTQTGGTITGLEIAVGNSSAGTFTQSSGANSVTQYVVGIGAGGSGVYTLSGGGTLVSNDGYIGAIGATGTFNQSGGMHVVSNLTIGEVPILTNSGGNGIYNLSGGNLVAGVIDTVTDGTAQFNFTGGTLAVGTFIGNLVNNGGTLAPGASPGTTVVQSDYTQSATGILSIELGGTDVGLFDVLQVTGTATLGGDLDVAFWNGFSAAAGDSFDIVSATNLLGGFDTLNLATLGTGLVWSVDYLYDQDLAGTDYVRLSVQAVPEAETYAMMLAGLGLVSWAARRKQVC